MTIQIVNSNNKVIVKITCEKFNPKRSCIKNITHITGDIESFMAIGSMDGPEYYLNPTAEEHGLTLIEIKQTEIIDKSKCQLDTFAGFSKILDSSSTTNDITTHKRIGLFKKMQELFNS